MQHDIVDFLGDIEVFGLTRPSIMETEVPADLAALATTMDWKTCFASTVPAAKLN